MAVNEETKRMTKELELGSRELEAILNKAKAKVGAKKDNELCRYIPGETGGYMHHFTLKKLKSRDPAKLCTLINEFIIEPKSPATVAPKKRAARGSRKRHGITLNPVDLEKLLGLARRSGDVEMVARLTPKRSLPQLKRELIAVIRQGKVDQELWTSYVEAVRALSPEAAQEGLGEQATLIPQGTSLL